jgi:hypothetical protein
MSSCGNEAQGGVPQPLSAPPAAASSSSQAVPPTFDIEAAFSQLMSSMGDLQDEVTLIGECVEQFQIDIRECLQDHHPTADDEVFYYYCSFCWLLVCKHF